MSSTSRKRGDHDSSVPAPRKMRKLSGYNCWHRQFLQSPGMGVDVAKTCCKKLHNIVIPNDHDHYHIHP